MPWIVANRTRPTRSGSPALERALGLALLDQLEHHREGPLGGFVQRARLLAVLAGEHQLEQRRIARGEADVGRRRRPQPRLEVLAGAVDGAAQLGAEAREPRLRRARRAAPGDRGSGGAARRG